MPLRFLPLLLLLTLAGCAAEVVAWKVPLSLRYHDGVKGGGIVKMDPAPEASVFFNKGDELWDLSKVETARGFHGLEWLVWNETTGRLVVKGSSVEIGRFRERLEPYNAPVRVKLTAEVFSTVDGKRVRTNAKPELSLSVLSGNGEPFDGNSGEAGHAIHLKGILHEQPEDPFHSVAEVELHASMKGQPDLVVKTSVPMESGVPLRLAGDGDERSSMEVMLICRMETPDGTPLDQMALVEGKDGPRPIMEGRGHEGIVKAGRGLLGTFRTSGESLAFSLGGERAIMPEVVLPGDRFARMGRPLLDVREILRGNGVPMKEGDVAGYDPLEGYLYFLTDDPEAMERCGIFGFFSTVVPAMTLNLDGPRRSYVMVRGGALATLQRHQPGGQPGSLLSFEVEQTAGEEPPGWVYFHLDYHFKGNPGLHAEGDGILKGNAPVTIPGENGGPGARGGRGYWKDE